MFRHADISELLDEELELTPDFYQCPVCESYNVNDDSRGYYECSRCGQDWELLPVSKAV